MNREWELAAACRDRDPEIWFDGTMREKALEICADCPVRSQCLDAVLHRETGVGKTLREGVTAGLTGAQRYVVSQERKRETQQKTVARKPKDRARRTPAPCGTRRAYQRHIRRGEPIDSACRDANAAGRRKWAATGSTEARAAG
ncbi:WhiB family transcriptional regulator [Streptomyces spectabilis]|uniref:WhiB family transcriptional regulator n=1 Tax=Streptomyces spectabilis TaxID=68270 RepID=UPI0034118D12